MTTASLLFDQATALFGRLSLPMLFLDAGEVAITGSYAHGWLRTRLLTADLRLSAAREEQDVLRLAGRLLTVPIVRSLAFARARADEDPRTRVDLRILSAGESWTLELSIWPPSGRGLQEG